MVLATAGPRRIARAPRKNLSDLERALSAAAGGVLVASAVRKRGFGGLVLAMVGAELLRRGATGHCMVYDTIGFDGRDGERRLDVTSAAATVNARKAIKIERSILIRRSPRELYEFWRSFSNLPRVLDDVESVTDLGGGRSHWVAKGPAGVRVEWDSEIVNDIPGELIAWKTVGEPDVAHAGSVHFDETAGGTQVRLVMDYEPPAGRFTALAAAVVGESPDQKIQSDLGHLKMLLES